MDINQALMKIAAAGYGQTMLFCDNGRWVVSAYDLNSDYYDDMLETPAFSTPAEAVKAFVDAQGI